MPKKPEDISNMRFGNLKVIGISHRENGKLYWKCICDCGDTCYALNYDLKRGRTFCERCDDEKSKFSPLKSLYGNYQRAAIRRGLEFDVSIPEFIKLINSNCYYCGSTPMQKFKRETMKNEIVYNGIDRMDNSLGYNKENVVPCCKYCNFAKGESTHQEFQEWIERLIKFKTRN